MKPRNAASDFRVRCCALILLGLFLLLPGGGAQQASITGNVVDARNQPVAGAQILGSGGELLATTAADGSFTVPAGSGRVQIAAAHFEPTSVDLNGPSPGACVVGTPAGERHGHRLQVPPGVG